MDMETENTNETGLETPETVVETQETGGNEAGSPPEPVETAPKEPKTEEKAPKDGLLEKIEKAAKELEIAPKVAALPPKSVYTPGTKFKVLDKEHEISKEFHSMMTDAETERKVKELHEKAYGLDIVKPKYIEVRDERNALRKENGELQGGIQELRDIYQKATSPGGNLLHLDKFFKNLQIPEDVILQYAISKVEFSELPPEHKQVIAGRMAAEQRAEELEKSNQSTQSQLQELSAQNLQNAFNQGIANPQVKPLADVFDARAGKPGAFAQEVIMAGKMAWYESDGKVLLSPEQAIQQVIERHSLTVPAAAPKVAPAPQEAPAKKPAATIPNVSGRSASPLPSKPRSVEDLRELYKQYN